NAGETVELNKPTTLLGGQVSYVLVDEVSYRDSAPWPAGADGAGLSIQRKDSTAYGNDPANWTAAPPTAAARTASGGAAPIITAQPQSQHVLVYHDTMLSVSASGTAPLRYQWRWNGASLRGATNSVLQLTNAQPAQAGDYDG